MANYDDAPPTADELAALAAKLEQGSKTSRRFHHLVAEQHGHSEYMPRTRKAYRSDWLGWTAFCKRYGFEPLPATPEAVRLYLAEVVAVRGRTGRPLRAATALHHLHAIAAAHRARDLELDVHHSDVKAVIRALRQTECPRLPRIDPLRPDDIRLLCARSSLSSHDVRDKAMILLAYNTRWRAAQLMALNVADVLFVPIDDGAGDPAIGAPAAIRWALKVRTDRGCVERPEAWQVVLPAPEALLCPVQAVLAWLRFADIEREKARPIFRAIDRWGTIYPERLKESAFNRIVRRICQHAGLVGRFSGASLRPKQLVEEGLQL